jgi:hypothetical protein
MEENESQEVDSSPEPVARTTAPVRRTRGFLTSTMNRKTDANIVMVKGMPKRRITFTVASDTCSPGVFSEDFELTLESLDSRMEIECARKSKGDATSMAFWYAYHGMSEVNGDRINDAEAEREWLWEALGPARQLVMGLFARGCMVDAESQGKAFGSLRID